MEPVDRSRRPERAAVVLNPVGVPSAAEVLAGELRELILSCELADGDTIPSERVLVEQTETSRATVREALRILEIQNLIRKRAGRAGGAIVQRPTTKLIAASLTMVIRGQQIKLAALMETRQALEPFCAKLAARNRIDDDLAMLDRADADIANAGIDLAAFLKASLDWHVAVAMASHNEMVIGFMTALSHAIYANSENAPFIDDTMRTAAARAHRSITDAIRRRDASAAARRMQRHVRCHADAALGGDGTNANPVD